MIILLIIINNDIEINTHSKQNHVENGKYKCIYKFIKFNFKFNFNFKIL